MKPEFICHPDFKNLEPFQVFHKQRTPLDIPNHPSELLNKHIVYRRHFALGSVGKAILKITADDKYKLYINGKYVAEGPSPSYPHCYYYNEIDVSKYLRTGSNLFAVHTYYEGLRNSAWVSGDLRQMMWLSLSVDGETVLVSDADWLVKYSNCYYAINEIGYNTAFTEGYDCTSPDKNIYFEDYDESGMVHAAVRNCDHVLKKQSTPPVTVYRKNAESVTTNGNTVRMTLDCEAVGDLYAVCKGNRGDKVMLKFAEELTDEGELRYDMRCGCKYLEEWILSGETDTLYQFNYKPFRYCEIILPDSAKLYECSINVRHYPFVQKHFYNTDNERLQKIFDLCINTIKYGIQERHMDCLGREKASYLGDAAVSGRAQAILTSDATCLKQNIEDFAETSFICPGLLAVCGSTRIHEIADYSLEFAAMLTWIYSFDGDIDFLRRMEPYATGVYRYFTRYENENGLIGNVFDKWNLVDWPSNLRDGYDFLLTEPVPEGRHNVLNALWYGTKIALNEIYSILGITGVDVEAEKTLKGYYDAFYSEKTGLFTDAENSDHTAVHSIIFPLLFGMTEKGSELSERLIDLIADKGLSCMGVYMAYFALAALKLHGREDLCIRLATDECAWMNMLSEGATTTFEAWGKDQKSNCSLFHPWATAPLIIFQDKYRLY